MTPTPNVRSEDAIIQLSPGRKTFDAGIYLCGILREEFKPENNDGRRVVVDFAEVMKTFIFRDEDYVILYQVSSINEPVTLGYQFENVQTVYSLDIFTSKDRVHLNRLVAEVKRVVQKHRVDTSGTASGIKGRVWLQWGIRESPFDQIGKGHYRRTIDVQINHRFNEIQA